MSQAAVLASLQPQVGQEVHVSDWFEVTQARIDAFAAATGDHQWIHVDPERAARESPWKSTIAHGYYTLSLYPMLRGLVDERPRQDGETLVAEPVFDLVCVRIGVHDKNNTMRGARPWPRRWT